MKLQSWLRKRNNPPASEKLASPSRRCIPGGKAQFDDELLDVITRGEMVAKGQRVKIIGHTGPNAIVAGVS